MGQVLRPWGLSMMHRFKLLLRVSLTSVMLASAALAQDAEPAAAPADGNQQQVQEKPSFLGKESSQGVYVRDSTIAVEKFALASRMERLKEWDKAADALQELVEKYTDRVVPSQKDAKDVIYQYTSVTRAVHEQLAKWPAEGLEAYRARYESVARTLLDQQPDDLTNLNRVYTRYFPTDTGKVAAIQLIDRHFESGEFPAAAWTGDRLLKLHPFLNEDRPLVLYRTALAYHLSGDDGSAKPLLEELKTKHPDASGTIQGKETPLSPTLEKELSSKVPIANAVGADSWPTIGGSPSRSRLTSAVGRMGTKIFDVPYVQPSRSVPTANEANFAQNQNNAREKGQTLGVMPVVDRGELFFQDNANVYAVNLDSGLPLPGWATTHADRNGIYAAPRATPLPRSLQSAVTVTDKDVLAITGQFDREAVARGMFPSLDHENRLVCLDRTTGAEKWNVTMRSLPDQAADLRDLELGASPLVAGDQVFVIARGGKPNQFDDCYVLCFGLSDGKYRWSCYLASGNTGGDADGNFGITNNALPHLAYASGRVYALTNLGALGAIDAYNGATVWLNLYPRPKPEAFDYGRRMERPDAFVPPKPSEQNPVFVDNGRVFVMPTDGEHLLVYDAGSGVELKKIPLSEINGARTLLAVSGDRAVICSPSDVICLNWRNFDPKNEIYDNIFWRSPLVKSSTEKESIRGRGFVTESSVFVSTSWAINRISMKTGRIEETYPKERAWDAAEGPGNIVVTQDHVIIAGIEGVNVYTDIEIARAKLDASVAAAPGDPNPRIEYAEVMFVAGQQTEAATRLDEAIELLGGSSAMRPGRERDRVFNAALTFARKLTPTRDDRSQPDPAKVDLAAAFYDRAATAAFSPAQQVNYRVTRAKFESVTNDVAEELRLYQEILLEPQWRPIRLTNRDDGTVSTAATTAEHAIKRIITLDKGKDAFATYQDAAQNELRQADAAKDVPALLGVAQRYPNTAAAPTALLQAAAQQEAARQHRQATAVLRQVLLQYRDQVDESRVTESMVRNYLKLPNGTPSAIARLVGAIRRSGDQAFTTDVQLIDNTTFPAGTRFSHAVTTLRQKSAALASQKLPKLGIPIRDNKNPLPAFVPEDARLVIDNIDSLIVPTPDFARHDRVVAFTVGRGLSIFETGSTTPLATVPTITDQPAKCAWVGDDQKSLLLWSPTSISMLKPDGTEAAWQVQLSALSEIDIETNENVVVDAPVEAEVPIVLEDNRPLRIRQRFQAMQGAAAPVIMPRGENAVEAILHVVPLSDRVLLATSTGRVMAIEYETGSIAWQTRLSVAFVPQFIAVEDFAAIRVTDNSGQHIVVFDSYNGSIVIRPKFTPESGVPVNMALSPDGTLVYTFSNKLCLRNLHDPARSPVIESPAGSGEYDGASLPDQLLVIDDRIIAVSDKGVLVRVHSLEDGKEVIGALNTGAGSFPRGGSENSNVHLRVVGSSLYVITPTSAVGYNLDRPNESWAPTVPPRIPPNFQDVFIGDKYLVLLDQGNEARADMGRGNAAVAVRPNAQNANIGYPRCRLWAYGRYPVKSTEGAESGRLDHMPTITHPVGIAR